MNGAMQSDNCLPGTCRTGNAGRSTIITLNQLALRGMEKDCPFFPRIFKRPLKLFLTTDRSEPALCIGMIECIQSRL